MFSVKCNGLIRNNPWGCLIHRNISLTPSRTTTKNVSVPSDTAQKDVEVHRPLTEHEVQKIINLDNIHIVTKLQTKLPQRPPLIKNFFIGKIDNAILTYPQVMEVKDFNELSQKLQPVSNYFTENASMSNDEKFRDVTNQVIDDFRRMKLFGSSVHQRYGGSGYFKSEMHWASESEANDIKSFLVLAAHRLAVEAISDHGNIIQHNEHLMAMARGETIGAICLNDPFNKTESLIITKSRDNDYILNGSKKFVICSKHANLLIVLAEKSDDLKQELDEADDDEDYFDSHIAIVVDPNASGITISDENPTVGCVDVPFVTLNFSNVRVGKDQLLLENQDDRKTSEKLIASARLQSATLNMVLVKNILTRLVRFSLHSECNSEKLRDLLYVRQNLAKIACRLYGLESMIYLTTGILDQYDNPKVELECAVTKAFSQDLLQSVIQLGMNLIHTPSTILSHPIGFDIRDGTQLLFGETSNALKSYVGKTGLQHAMDHFGHKANNYKNSFWVKIGLDNPTIEYMEKKLFLGDFLHPTFMNLSADLEFSILRSQFSCEMLMCHYGEAVADRHVEMHSLGEAAMWNYAMFASIARASRSYCIGLRYAAYETVVVESLFDATKKVLKMALDIKHKRSGYHGYHKAVAEAVINKHRNQLNPLTV